MGPVRLGAGAGGGALGAGAGLGGGGVTAAGGGGDGVLTAAGAASSTFSLLPPVSRENGLEKLLLLLLPSFAFSVSAFLAAPAAFWIVFVKSPKDWAGGWLRAAVTGIWG